MYAPISYGPLPLLAFTLPDPHVPGSVPRLAATGSLRGCDPDRVVLKRIVITGYPVRVHKTRATVRLMFHSPEDVLRDSVRTENDWSGRAQGTAGAAHSAYTVAVLIHT